MDTEVEDAHQQAMADLQKFGLLLKSDPQLPNVAGIVGGKLFAANSGDFHKATSFMKSVPASVTILIFWQQSSFLAK